MFFVVTSMKIGQYCLLQLLNNRTVLYFLELLNNGTIVLLFLRNGTAVFVSIIK